MSDEQRSAKDEAGPEETLRVRPFTDSPDDDAEGHKARLNSPEPAAPDPESEPTDDTEGHRRKFH